MRDIRDDLRQRVAALRKERDELQTQLKAKLLEIDEYERHLDSLLAFEEKRAGAHVTQPKAQQDELTLPAGAGEATYSDFEGAVLDILGDGQVWQHGDIKAALEKRGWKAVKGSLGRKLQGVLIGMMKNKGLIEFAGNAGWRRSHKAATAA
jgi:hypothetical protein